MQLLSPLTRDRKAMNREKPAGHHLPYARHVDDHNIETRDGMLMQVIHLRGLLFETADTDELNYRKRLRDATLQAIGSSRYALYHHIIRRRVDVELSSDHPDAFSSQLDEAWRARLATRKLYVNELFLTLIRRPLQGRAGRFDRLGAMLGGRRPRRTPAPPMRRASWTSRAMPCWRRSAAMRRGCSASTRRRRGRARSRSNSSPRCTMARCARC